MSVADRIERLKHALKEQEAQRDWLVNVDWQDSHQEAGQAAMEHDRIIAVYESLIRRLEGSQ